MARIICTSDPMPADSLGQLALYNGMDCLSLGEIFAGISPLMSSAQWATYHFEMELQAALLEMEFTGILVDQNKRGKMVGEFSALLEATKHRLHLFCEAVGYYDYYLTLARIRFAAAVSIPLDEAPDSWDAWKAKPIQWRRAVKQASPEATVAFQKDLKTFSTPFNGNSSTQKLRLFYDFFGHEGNTVKQQLSPDFPALYNKTRGIDEIRTRNQQNEYTPSTDRDSLDKIRTRSLDAGPGDACFTALPFISHCLEIADLAKSLGFLKCRLESGIFRSSFSAATETGRLNSKENAMGFGSNAQNITPKLRSILIAEPGWKIAAPDLEQAESRTVGAICYRLFGATAYLDAQESGDPHTLVCSLIWPDLDWPSEFNLAFIRKYGSFPADLLKAAKAIANQKFYRHFSYRDMAKRGSHGSNYLGKPQHMAKMLHVQRELMEHFQAAYFEAFPEIQRWHRWVAEQIQTKGEITTLLGRQRRFFGRPNDDATLREAIAFEPQSVATGDYTNLALLEIYKRQRAGLPVRLFLQKHDEIGFRYKEPDEDYVVPIVCGIMEQHITIYSPDNTPRDWSIPADAATGWNLGKYDAKSNPDGLKGYKGHDDRTRQQIPNNLLSWRF